MGKEPNGHRERPGPAATGTGIQPDQNGWLGSAPGWGYAISS